MDYLLKNVEDDFWRQLKSKCALEGLTIRDLIITLLEDWVQEKPKKEVKKK